LFLSAFGSGIKTFKTSEYIRAMGVPYTAAGLDAGVDAMPLHPHFHSTGVEEKESGASHDPDPGFEKDPEIQGVPPSTPTVVWRPQVPPPFPMGGLVYAPQPYGHPGPYLPPGRPPSYPRGGGYNNSPHPGGSGSGHRHSQRTERGQGQGRAKQTPPKTA
jgi:hypothetical protein